MRFVLLLALVLAPAAARAQPTNAEVYERLALACLADVPDTLRALSLDASERMPYVRTALVQHWQREGRTLYLADTSATPPRPLPRLTYRIERAEVTYAREDDRLRRAVTLALRYTLTAQDRRLLHDQSCRDTFEDVVVRGAPPALEDAARPETQGAVPERRGWRRYAEPAVLAAAVGTAVYLFFSLRSDSDEP